MIRLPFFLLCFVFLFCGPVPKYILREPINGVPKGIVIYGIFLYEESEIPILGKRYNFLIPFPALTTLKKTCKNAQGQKESCGLNLVRDADGPEIMRDKDVIYRLADRTGLSTDGKNFPYHVLGDMDGLFQYEIINIGSFSSKSVFGTDGIRKAENSYTDYTISNSENFPIDPPTDRIDFKGIFAYRAVHIKTKPYWIGDLEEGLPVLKKINDERLNRHFFGEKEFSLENAKEHALELLKKDQSKGYWGR